MARTTKPTSKSTETETTVVATTAPVVEKAVKAKKAPVKKEAAPVVPAVEESVVASAEADVETPLTEKSIEFLAKLQQVGALISSLKNEYRALEKVWQRELKASQKQNSKRKRKAGNRAPSGFVKPARISDELASFLGKDKGTEMARTDVTRDINKYIRENKLQDVTNGRRIHPDTKLAKLLKLAKDDVLTYFNLQKFMSCHFPKAVKPVEAVA